jgi:hypothetical protein
VLWLRAPVKAKRGLPRFSNTMKLVYTFADIGDEVLRNCRVNVDANLFTAGCVRVRELDWSVPAREMGQATGAADDALRWTAADHELYVLPEPQNLTQWRFT